MLPKAIQKLVISPNDENAHHVESIFLSLIDINLISAADRGHKDPFCREKLIEYLNRKGLWRSINDLFLETYPRASKEVEELSSEEKTLILQGKRRLKGSQGGRFFGDWYYFNPVQGLYLDLQESVLLKKDAFIDRDFFAYFFAFRLSKKDLNSVNSFLIINFREHFDDEWIAFMDFCRHEIIPSYSKLLGKEKIAMLRSFLKKLQNLQPYSRVKTIKVKEKPLEEFFADTYDGKRSSELFRTHVVHQILKKNGRQVTGIKGKLNMIYNLLRDGGIWKSDLELITVANTLKAELRLKTLSSKVFQTDQRKGVDPQLQKALSLVKWVKAS